jgi:hypothetical protein
LFATDRRADAAAADRHTAFHRSRRDRLAERDDEVRVVVAGIQGMRPEVDDFVAGRAEMRDQVFLQRKPP